MAWHPLGWEPVFFAEISRFPSAVLHHHYPKVVNLGDFTTIHATDPIDLLVGGTPCQAFSVAGNMHGLDDPRGNLSLEFIKLVGRIKPRWFLWENVPGVLSIDEGRTFGTILGAMAKLGYGFSYRVLDARCFGVPQRRRRVFIVGFLGDWRPAAAVLFEQETVSLNSTKKQVEKASLPCLLFRRPQRICGSQAYVVDGKRIRFFTPREYEMQQGFPVDYTAIPGATDTRRYQAVGNSMPVPVMRWLGERIERVHSLLR